MIYREWLAGMAWPTEGTVIEFHAACLAAEMLESEELVRGLLQRDADVEAAKKR